MSFKDDPLHQTPRPGYRDASRTLWLEREGMLEARENYWRAYNELYPTAVGTLDDKHHWDLAWAATVAAFGYLMEGRISPR